MWKILFYFESRFYGWIDGWRGTSVLLIWLANESVPPITMQCNSSLSANSNHKIINLIPTTIEVEVEGYTAIINHKP